MGIKRRKRKRKRKRFKHIGLILSITNKLLVLFGIYSLVINAPGIKGYAIKMFFKGVLSQWNWGWLI